jgi:hypothetical protein
MSLLHAALFAELQDNAAVAALVGEESDARIWRSMVPQRLEFGGEDRLPCVVLNVGSLSRQVANCGTVATVEARVQIDCYSADHDEAWSLAAAVRSALLDFRGMLGGALRVRAASIESETEILDPEPGVYRVMQSWQIWHKEG